MLRSCAALLTVALTGLAAPAQAVEWLELKGPLGAERLSVRLAELQSPEALWAGSSDLAELNRASGGALGRSLQALLTTPLPATLPVDLDNPMVRQLELLLQSLLEPVPAEQQLQASEAGFSLPLLRQVVASGQPLTLLQVLQAVPGERRTISLERALQVLRQSIQPSSQLEQQLAAQMPLPAAPPQVLRRGSSRLSRSQFTLPSGLELTLVRPLGAPSLPTVLISHGLWDSPSSFLGWAEHLASHGAVVLLPRHSGSDRNQQAEMLAGLVPPPSPQEFLRRPQELKQVLDALEAGAMAPAAGARSRDVVLIGHSWGATSALQLAGARSLPSPLWQACQQADHPVRNPSWVLQCSLLEAASPASLLDRRLARVVAVSPPQALLFDAGLQDLAMPVLLVSGSRDLVVPAVSEAIQPFQHYPPGRSQLLIVRDGTHFNLPSPEGADGGPLRAALLAWVKGQPLESPAAVADPAAQPLFQLR